MQHRSQNPAKLRIIILSTADVFTFLGLLGFPVELCICGYIDFSEVVNIGVSSPIVDIVTDGNDMYVGTSGNGMWMFDPKNRKT